MTDQVKLKGWRKVKFGDIAKNISKRVEPSETDLDIYIGLEHLDPNSLRIKRHGNPADVKGQKLLVKKGQIIFGKRRAYQRKLAIADCDCICSAHAMVLEPKKEKIVPDFLPFFMQSDAFMKRAKSISEGSLSPTIKWKTLENQEFQLPDIESQKRVAAILKQALKVSEKFDSLTTSGQLLIKNLRHHLFSNNSIPENLGSPSKTWKQVPLWEVGHWQSGGTPSKSKETYWDGNIPWFSPKDMKSPELKKSLLTVTEEGARNGTRSVDENTILIVVRGMILAHTFPVGITHQTSTFNQDIKALVLSEDFSPRFVLHWLIHNADLFLSKVTTATHGTCRLSTDVFKQVLIPKPPKFHQEKIANLIDQTLEIVNSNHKKHIQDLNKSIANAFLFD
ncbi:restriction endonuclease subunit S [Marinobacter sp. MA]|uniref:restriction endonuclease subunit S n=1 Tax=Marinobacter TaxID=2742 RepID=UPI000D0E7659|nr:restriction endonuclease subunit S [Marinobacter shengliensis]PSF10804.1 restriction endonuclease subunit S [Marinobacter shengliensis]